MGMMEDGAFWGPNTQRHFVNSALSYTCSEFGSQIGHSLGMAGGAYLGGSVSFGTMVVPSATIGAVIGYGAGLYLGGLVGDFIYQNIYPY